MVMLGIVSIKFAATPVIELDAVGHHFVSKSQKEKKLPRILVAV